MMVRVFVPDVPEFASLVEAARKNPACTVRPHAGMYFAIESEAPLEFERRALGVKPAIWYGLFTGGIEGRIALFDRDLVRIVPDTGA